MIAAIVTRGGLCLGLNDVIRALVMVLLWYRYGVKEILGIRFGHKGLLSDSENKPVKLTPPGVEDINKMGGSVLGSSRGNQSYIIRSAPASSSDSVFCFQLASNAAHAAMAQVEQL